MKGRRGRTRTRVHQLHRTCPLCPNHVSGASASRVPLRSYARLQDLSPPGAAMNLSDTLVFGPLHPLLPQPVRVRLVALLVALVGLVGGLGILTFAGLVLVLGPAALPASARSLLPGWASPAEPNATTQQIGRASC